MRPLRPQPQHAATYPNIRQAARVPLAVGAALVVGLSAGLPSLALAGDPPETPPPPQRMGGRRAVPSHPTPQVNRIWTITAYLNDGSYAGVQLNVTPTLTGDISYLAQHTQEINVWVQTFLAPSSCHNLDLPALNAQLVAYLNSLDPSASYAVAGVNTTLQFCEWGGPVDGDMVAPEYF